MEKIIERIRQSFEEFNKCYESSVWRWLSSNVFNLTTYDDELDELFSKEILEVCKVILKEENFEYIKNKENYVKYIRVCNLLERNGWIDWGTSIRGAWFEDCEDEIETKNLCSFLYLPLKEPIPFTKENLKALIEFVENKENEKS